VGQNICQLQIWSDEHNLQRCDECHSTGRSVLGRTVTLNSRLGSSTLPQSSAQTDLAMAKVQIWRVGHKEYHARYLDDPHSTPPTTLSRETSARSSNGDLAGPESSASPSPNWGQATARFWPAIFTVPDDNSLRCVLTVQAMTRRLSIFFALRTSCRHDHPPTTWTQTTLDACGPFWSRSGMWHAPLTRNERERVTLKMTGKGFYRKWVKKFRTVYYNANTSG